MPIPVLAALPVIAKALMAGAALVPHSSGGVIALLGGKYVAGTFLSSAAVTTLKTLGIGGAAGVAAAILKAAMR